MSKTERFHMLRPDQVADAAKKKEKQNLRFRTYLKTHADEAELDSRFAALHAELFSGYDCSACRNCCRLVSACIKAWDIPAIAAHLSMTEGDFKDRFLVQGDFGEWGTKHTPCDFLLENGECMLGDCKPEGCKDFPYTGKPERLASLLSVLSAAEVCPVALEIIERLKDEYGFR